MTKWLSVAQFQVVNAANVASYTWTGPGYSSTSAFYTVYCSTSFAFTVTVTLTSSTGATTVRSMSSSCVA